MLALLFLALCGDDEVGEVFRGFLHEFPTSGETGETPDGKKVMPRGGYYVCGIEVGRVICDQFGSISYDGRDWQG